MFEQREYRLNERTSDAASSLPFPRLQVAFSLPGVSRPVVAAEPPAPRRRLERRDRRRSEAAKPHPQTTHHRVDGPQHQPYGLTSHLGTRRPNLAQLARKQPQRLPGRPVPFHHGPGAGRRVQGEGAGGYGANHPRGLGADRFSDQATQRIDDYRADIDTTSALTTGEPQDAWVASGGDVDWFALELRAAYSYDITVDGDEGLVGAAYRSLRRRRHRGAREDGLVGRNGPGVHARNGRHVFRVGGRHG